MKNNTPNGAAITTLDDLFSKVDLYVDYSFKVYQENNDGKMHINKNELERMEIVLGMFQSSIDAFCIFCNKTYPFTIKQNSSSKRYSEFSSINAINIGEDIFINMDNPKYDNLPPVVDKDNLHEFLIDYVTFDFACKKSEKHIYRMYTILLIRYGEITIRKIGQYPSKIDIWGFDFDQYRNQLNKINAYSDFKKAELCMSDGLYAGAYAYLRRVFEKMLKEYCKGLTLENNRVETKIEACIDKFDERVRPLLKNLYSILSIGIHELDDKQSERFYVYLRTVLEMQLEYVKENNDRDNQTKELKDKIDSIVNDLK